MLNSTSNTYILKRKILTFTNKISKRLSKPEKKFVADITYGMLVSGSCLLTDVTGQLHESSKKINIVDRLSRHLEKGVPASALFLIFSKSNLLPLPTGKRHLRYTVVCKRGRQALVPDKASGIPSTLP